MSTPGSVKVTAFIISVLFALSLSAQRYQPQDHHLFHSPAPVQAKHQPAQPAGNAARTHTTSASNVAATRGREANYSASTTSGTPRTAKPAVPESDPVH